MFSSCKLAVLVLSFFKLCFATRLLYSIHSVEVILKSSKFTVFFLLNETFLHTDLEPTNIIKLGTVTAEDCVKKSTEFIGLFL